MAEIIFDAKPSSWISSWAEDATNVTFPLASLDQTLTAAEADATTGDWRKCFFSIIDHTFQYYNGLAAADKPGKLSITKNASLQSDGTYVLTYQIRVTTDVTAQDVSSET